MKPWHPWATLQDLAGNVWCDVWHHRHWTATYYPGGLFEELLRSTFTCGRCGRKWWEQKKRNA
jgi:hypothetical protein